jgi:predicted dehydrogenase
VDDLCAAIFRADERAEELSGSVLSLGDERGCTLAELLDLIATAQLGRPKRSVTVPLGPVQAAVEVAERAGASLPVTSNNLRAVRRVDRMETAPSLARLGIALRPLAETVRPDPAPGPSRSPDLPPLDRRSVRVVLVGAGRIGLVHAVTLSRLHGVTLAALVDRRPSATALLRGMGVTAPCFTDLDEALAATRPDAVVIATPPSSHVPLTAQCLERGLAVMVEKPLAVNDAQLRELSDLAQRHPDRPIQVGYVMPRNPQIAACLERLRAGDYGRVLGFSAFTLLSLIHAPAQKRWEVQPDISGGGALINAGGHVLSMIQAAFGEPRSVTAEQARRYSTDVEDALVIRFEYPGFQGVQYCSWAIEGFPRQENDLIVRTDRGTLTLTGSVGVFVADDGTTEVTHQLDFEVGFNLAPDYAGGGFTTELLDLAEAARTGKPAPMSLEAGAQVERLLFEVYARSRAVSTFTSVGEGAGEGAGEAERVAPAMVEAPRLAALSAGGGHALASESPRLVLDLRGERPPDAVGYLLRYWADRTRSARWDGFLLTAPQHAALAGRWHGSEGRRVTVPDFLSQSRLLSNGRYLDVVRGMGLRGILRAGLMVGTVVAAQRKLTFWGAALGLLAADLEKLPPDYDGTILIHPYLTDFALALRQYDMLERMLRASRRVRPRARVGLHTNMAAEAAQALDLLAAPVDEVSALSAPNALGMAGHVAALRTAGRDADGGAGRSVVVEVGLAPAAIHRVAAVSPERWAFGAGAVIVDGQADRDVAHSRRQELERAWTQAFPGLMLPDLVP